MSEGGREVGCLEKERQVLARAEWVVGVSRRRWASVGGVGMSFTGIRGSPLLVC